MREGRGLGSYALVEIATMPQRFQDKIKRKIRRYEFRDTQNVVRKPLPYRCEGTRVLYRFRFEDGSACPEHINEYTVNASAIQAVVDVMADTVIMRRAKKGSPVNWNELAGAINYYREGIRPHAARQRQPFKRRVSEFKAQGYESLIGRKFRNQNRRKVTYSIADLIRGLGAMTEHPYDTVVAEMYNWFVTRRPRGV